jgi:holliday junction DNA helicase RuvB
VSTVLGGDYPTCWGDFVGQEAAKRELQIKARSAAKRGAPMDPVMLDSPVPGLGKTSLALLTAGEIGAVAGHQVNVRVDSGTIKLRQAGIVLGEMAEGDVWFIDEAHRLVDGGARNADWLLHYLADGVLMGPFGAEDVPRVTVIAATTNPGKLPGPLLDRFIVRPQLVPYSDMEGALITTKISARMFAASGLPIVTGQTSAALAQAAGNRPRMIAKLLASLRDLAVAEAVEYTPAGEYDLDETLTWAGLTPDGLTAPAQAYLRVLYHKLRGNPAGEKQLQDRLGLEGSEFKLTEQLLMDRGLVGRGANGRELTPKGKTRARNL